MSEKRCFEEKYQRYWYDISTKSKLAETREILAQRFSESIMDLVKRFEDDYELAVQYLLEKGFEKYIVDNDLFE